MRRLRSPQGPSELRRQYSPEFPLGVDSFPSPQHERMPLSVIDRPRGRMCSGLEVAKHEGQFIRLRDSLENHKIL